MTSGLQRAVTEAKRTGDYNRFVQAIPYLHFLGITVEATADGLMCRLGENPMLIGNPMIPALHGGVVGALLESAAVMQLLWAQETVTLPKTIDFSIDYLRSVKPRQTYASGVITKHGRRVANVRVEAWQDDRSRPVATAHVHMLLA